jgi:tetrahydromethanopterin S-methyltransferase subunit B
MDFPVLVQHGIFYGLILSALFTVVLLGAVYVNVEIMLNDYPPDVKKAYGAEKNPKTRGQKRIFSLLFLAALFGVLCYSMVDLGRATELNFPILFVLVFVEVFTFNLWDLLVLDWLIFNTIQPKFIFLPGTEGMAGYKDYYFHFKGFLIGIVFSLLSALILSGIALIIVNATR